MAESNKNLVLMNKPAELRIHGRALRHDAIVERGAMPPVGLASSTRAWGEGAHRLGAPSLGPLARYDETTAPGLQHFSEL